MSSTLIPPTVLPHFDAVCDWMTSLPAEGAEEVGNFFKRLGDGHAGMQRALAQAKGLLASPEFEKESARRYITSIREMFWAAGIEPTDDNVDRAILARERYRSDPAHSLS